MARTKLKKFRENRSFPHMLEPSREELLDNWPLRGNWQQDCFANEKPLVLELGCGKGEYTVALARRYPDVNVIGVDVKGARMWSGARTVADEGLPNAAFLRCQIELIDRAFAAGEVAEIWITFPDPQIKFKRSKHRLTHPAFLERYRRILEPSGPIHLKTDSEFLHGYTQGILAMAGHSVEKAYFDIDRQLPKRDSILHTVQTHYEALFREKGKAITYLRFRLDHGE